MTKTTKTTRASKKAAQNNDFHMTTEVTLPTAAPVADDALLDGLLEELESVEASGAPIETADDAVEEIVDDGGAIQADAGAIGDEDVLAAAVEDAEREAAKKALYAEQESAGVSDGAAPATEPEALTEGDKKGKKKKAAAPKAPKEPKAPRASSITHKPGDLLKVKLGEKAGDFLTFDLNDATLSADDLAAKQQAFVDRMNDSEAIADKVREKITMFLVWMTKGGDLNEVMKRAITVLHNDGELTSGDKGNLQLNLLAKPYSMGTARSQANQMFMAFPELGLTIKEKGRMIPNPDSALLPMAKTMLGLI